jgi:hypothetical protein
MIHHFRGIILVKKIQDLTALWLQSIGFKPCSQSGVTLCMGMKNILHSKVSIRVKDDTLLVRKVNLKAHNIRNLLLHVEEIEPS